MPLPGGVPAFGDDRGPFRDVLAAKQPEPCLLDEPLVLTGGTNR
jgi:hypothetical protein